MLDACKQSDSIEKFFFMEIFLGALQERGILDDDVKDYIAGYLRDSSPDDIGTDGQVLLEFIQPLVAPDGDDQGVALLCQEFARTLVSCGNPAAPATEPLKMVDTPLSLQDIKIVSATAEYTVPQSTGDISLATRRRNAGSVVDKKKLEKEEARQQRKNEARSNVKLTKVDNYIDLKAMTRSLIVDTEIDPTLSKNRTRDIKIENFDISFGGKRILTNANLNLIFGRRYGLIGRNGVGKSTLLRALAHRDIRGVNKDGFVPDWLRILHIEQEIEASDISVLNCVLSADAYLTKLQGREREINVQLKSETETAIKEQLSVELRDIWTKLHAIDADKAPSRAAVILSGLGFDHAQQERAIRTFSGGWRMRVALARALFCRPDVLLCDEPTNFLDMNAVVWLETYLSGWPNTLFVVSHDRDFLDSVVTDILHMHNERLDEYSGDYSMFLVNREQRRKNEQREYESQLQYREHLQSFIDRWRYNANRAAQAQSKIKILEKLPPLSPPIDDGIEDSRLKIRWPDPIDNLPPPLLAADNITFGYTPERTILKDVSFSVTHDSRIAIVGGNGAGKSTLLKLLTGKLNPTRGIIHRPGRLRIAFFSQHHVETLDTDTASPVEFLADKFPGKNEEEYRSTLGKFGITGQTALQSIRSLSGGQKSRVMFAWMAFQNPHALILDEVTNHLDIMTVDALMDGLKEYQGAVVVVSHDVRFINSTCKELWVCEDGGLSKFKPDGVSSESGILEYKKKILKENEVKFK